jgi:hypothetical protein
LFVEIFVPNSKNIVVGVVYRSPNQNLSLFLDKFNEILSTISKNNKHCYVMGDYNIDMYCLNAHSATNEFVENLFSHMYLPLISMPTCITAHSATLFDNIFTNHLTQNLFSGIIINDLSDHLPVFVYVFSETPPPRKSAEKTIFRALATAILPNFVHILLMSIGKISLIKMQTVLSMLFSMNFLDYMILAFLLGQSEQKTRTNH